MVSIKNNMSIPRKNVFHGAIMLQNNIRFSLDSTFERQN